jgi:uncharacterized protein YegP (UPF0339 family)
MKFIVRRTRHHPSQFRVSIVGDNGESLFVSEAYTRKAKAMHAIEVIVQGVLSGQGSLLTVEDRTGRTVVCGSALRISP